MNNLDSKKKTEKKRVKEKSPGKKIQKQRPFFEGEYLVIGKPSPKK